MTKTATNVLFHHFVKNNLIDQLNTSLPLSHKKSSRIHPSSPHEIIFLFSHWIPTGYAYFDFPYQFDHLTHLQHFKRAHISEKFDYHINFMMELSITKVFEMCSKVLENVLYKSQYIHWSQWIHPLPRERHLILVILPWISTVSKSQKAWLWRSSQKTWHHYFHT